MQKLYAAAVRPAFAAIAVCASVAIALLLARAVPDTPLVWGAAAALAVFGALIPALVALLHRSRRPRLRIGAAAVAAMTAHAAATNDLVAPYPQAALTAVGAVLALATATVVLLAAAEARAARPGRDRI
ncbi:hypothetical protein [Glycomyces harbinensis]|uniref:Uncharacterized protein n=1 Tax=Glycomyces harbinensis TaxID=58114 RepID=A0A1G7B241_9ACTN|nr:hypothetical protein [Glycomyces harbinensis]SDE20990.1 hypothetical protein SAMN05216270_11589 [Glycomyces harbinensis]